jgi:hypothetical protein
MSRPVWAYLRYRALPTGTRLAIDSAENTTVLFIATSRVTGSSAGAPPCSPPKPAAPTLQAPLGGWLLPLGWRGAPLRAGGHITTASLRAGGHVTAASLRVWRPRDPQGAFTQPPAPPRVGGHVTPAPQRTGGETPNGFLKPPPLTGGHETPGSETATAKRPGGTVITKQSLCGRNPPPPKAQRPWQQPPPPPPPLLGCHLWFPCFAVVCLSFAGREARWSGGRSSI